MKILYIQISILLYFTLLFFYWHAKKDVNSKESVSSKDKEIKQRSNI